MFNKKETIDRLRKCYTVAYKKCLDIIFGPGSWERIKLNSNLSECQMQLRVEDCRENVVKGFSETDLFKLSKISDEKIENYFLEMIIETSADALNKTLLTSTSKNKLPI